MAVWLADPVTASGYPDGMSVLSDKRAVLQDLLADFVYPEGPSAYPSGLEMVQLLRMIRETAESALPQAVALARDEGASWEQLGRALGVTRQSAHERYA